MRWVLCSLCGLGSELWGGDARRRISFRRPEPGGQLRGESMWQCMFCEYTLTISEAMFIFYLYPRTASPSSVNVIIINKRR